MKRLDTDVAVVGAGCSGLAAAVSAAERGMRVAIFEKLADLPFGGVGTFGVESAMQRSKRILFTKEDAVKMFLRHSHYLADARLVRDYVHRSSDTIDWLQGMGVRFAEPIAYYSGGQFTWHMMDFQSPRTTEALAKRAEQLGGILYMQTPAKQLLTSSGRVSGLIAESKSGEAMEVNAGAVVVGTGGFSDNGEWVARYTSHELGRDVSVSTMFPGAPERLHGDGIRMAWEVGADQTSMYLHTYRGLPQPYGGPGGAQPELGIFRQPVLMVNLAGERFLNEDLVVDGALAGNAVSRQKESCGFAIFDDDTNQYYENNDYDWLLPTMPPRSVDVGSVILKAQSEGYKNLFLADSIEELCTKTGIDKDGLARTLVEYNKMCGSGRDDVFFKSARNLRQVRRPRFYAGKFILNAYVTLGGVRINHKAEALDRNADTIPGLYVVGNDSNDVCGDTYMFSLAGHMSGFAFNTGRFAGENASAYVAGLGR
ncbi:MAG: FAD-binding protein [Armatimonadetes bacterium]|nr:FAD-binding protein [Armatimonadota bacterium]